MNLQTYTNKASSVHELNAISDYAYFAKINEDNDQVNQENHNNLNTFYAQLSQTGVEYVYNDFAQFNDMDKESIVMTNEAIANEDLFPFATVDYNYLKLSKIKIFDANGNEVHLTKNDKDYFLFPDTYLDHHAAFIKQYKERMETEGVSNPIDESLYTYEGVIKRYNTNDDMETVLSSPFSPKGAIIRVTYDAYPINYINNMYGLATIGIENGTGLMINTHGDKAQTYQQIAPLLHSLALDKVYTEANFVSVGEVIGNELKTIELQIYTELFAMLMILAIDLLISVETNAMLIEKNNKEIGIRLLLGYSRCKVMQRMIKTLAIAAIGSVIVALGISFVIDGLALYAMLISCLIFILIELILFYLTTRKITLNQATSYIKGES